MKDFDDAILIELGRITVSFAQLERSLALHAGKFVSNNEDVIDIVTAGMESRRLAEMFHSLVLHKFNTAMPMVAPNIQDDAALRLQEVRRLIDQTREQRNRIVHSSWVMNIELEIGSEGDASVRHVTNAAIGLKPAHRKQGMFIDRTVYTADDLRGVVTAITETQHRLNEFMRWLVDSTAWKLILHPKWTRQHVP